MHFYSDFSESQLDSIVSEWKEKSFVFLHHTGFVYGMGCRIDDVKAVNKLRKLKHREFEKGFVILLPGFHAISNKGERLTDEGSNFEPISFDLDHSSLALIEQYMPGNLTLVLKHDQTSELLNSLAVDGKIAIRIPEDPTLRSFIDKLGVPVISTSINLAKEPPITDIEEIKKLDWFDFALVDPDHSYDLSTVSTIVEPLRDKIVCYREGSIPFSEVEKSYQNPLILFICTGNICRSPMAEYYARHEIKRNQLSFRTDSAGFYMEMVKISANSFSILTREGVEVDEHFSKKVNNRLMRMSWLVLTMEEHHYEDLLAAFPNSKHKIFTLARFSGFAGDIEDPYQRNLEVFESIYSQIKKFCMVLVDKLLLRTNQPIFIRQLEKEIIEE